MKIEYDNQADALYIQLMEDDLRCRQVRLSDDIALDFAVGEKLVGIEVLGAGRLFKSPERPAVELVGLLAKLA